jgi:hypothetical protein
VTGRARTLPAWEDYVSVGLDEIISICHGSIQVRRRMCRLLDELASLVPADRRGPVEVRRQLAGARGADGA